jgi:hypothetical protein
MKALFSIKRLLTNAHGTVIPAKAGIQARHRVAPTNSMASTDWIPAFAGMTGLFFGGRA